MQQYFIELGEGYSDIYELMELMETNQHRIHRTFIFASNNKSGQAISLAVAFNPARDSNFMPIYVCREGITQTGEAKPKRRLLFEEASLALGHEPIYIELKHSSEFAEIKLFYQYITGILRLNHLVPPLR
ncbi:methylthioribose kinase [Sporosarcina sp. UB5]